MAKKNRTKKTKLTRTSKARSSGGTGDSGGKADTIVRTYRFQRPLYDEFEEFCARHLLNTKLVIEASILHFMEATPDSRAAISAKTKNEYHAAAKGLMTWMQRHGLIEANPLLGVQRVDTVGEETFQRRALTVDECGRLVAASGRRGLLYAVAIETA